MCNLKKKMFSYFRRRYNNDKIKKLNNILKLRGKIRTLQLSTKFLKDCIIKRVSPRFITFRIQKSKVRPSPTIERAFINDEIEPYQIARTSLQIYCSLV